MLSGDWVCTWFWSYNPCALHESTLPFPCFLLSQVYTVRTLRPGEHETVRVKQSDVKKILVVS